MFTGIIEELGRVVSLDKHATGATLAIACRNVISDAVIGASISVNGACLTATSLSPDGLQADLAPETLARTNLGHLSSGSLVNLERPLRATSRLDGHFVLGHVDATAELTDLRDLGGGHWWLSVLVPQSVERYIVEKGSVALNGVSLTVAQIEGRAAKFTIIPHTWNHTSFQTALPGTHLNLEVDVLAKQLEKLAASYLVDQVRPLANSR